MNEVVSKCLQGKIKGYQLPGVGNRHQRFIEDEVDSMDDNSLTFNLTMESTLMAAGNLPKFKPLCKYTVFVFLE